VDKQDEIDSIRRHVALLQAENRELIADRQALLTLAADLRERLAQYEDGGPGGTLGLPDRPGDV